MKHVFQTFGYFDNAVHRKFRFFMHVHIFYFIKSGLKLGVTGYFTKIFLVNVLIRLKRKVYWHKVLSLPFHIRNVYLNINLYRQYLFYTDSNLSYGKDVSFINSVCPQVVI